MSETYYAGAYWHARSESAEACARRAELFFHLLGRSDPAWTRWYETADSFEEARKHPFTTDAANFKKLFGRKENQIGDGFTFWLWAGGTLQEASSIRGTCGSADPWLRTNCVLKPYEDGPIAERVLAAPIMTEVLRAMALAWEPEWGVATSEAHRDGFMERTKPGTFVGWIMYFSRLRGTVPPLPAPVRIEPVEDKGTLVILTPERFTASNPEHVALAARVYELLKRAGLLEAIGATPATG
jgi:hypothetical protein